MSTTSPAPAPRRSLGRLLWRLILGIIGTGGAIVLTLLAIGLWIGTTPSAEVALVITADGGAIELDGARIEFPPGALPAGTTVTLSRLATPPGGPDPRSRLAGPVFEVNTHGAPLSVTATVITPYTPGDLKGQPDGVMGASWDGVKWQRWRSSVDRDAHLVTYVVDHFSPLAAVEDVPLLGWDGDLPGTKPSTAPAPGAPVRQVEFSTSHFVITYATGSGIEPLHDEDYAVQVFEDVRNGVPHYVTDLGAYLESALAGIRARGYVMPPEGERIAVSVRPLSSAGATGPWGPIEIDNRMADAGGGLRPPDDVWRKLKPTAAHELFHVVQRYNPTFPTWFEETGAAYMEWMLFRQELPSNYTDAFGVRAADFPFSGMWSGDTINAYGKAAFLVFLREQHGAKCIGPRADVLKDGVMPSGAAPALLALQKLPLVNMRDAFVQAARRCSDFQGGWDDLWSEFVARYFATRWAQAEGLLSGDPTLQILNAADDHHSPAAGTSFRWSFKRTPRGLTTFTGFSWPEASAAMWEVLWSQEAPVGTLVFQIDGFANRVAYTIYGYRRGETTTDNPSLIQPLTLTAERPIAAVENFGGSGAVARVYLVGVHPGMPDIVASGRSYTAAPPSTVRAHFLATPSEATVATSPTDAKRLRVSWKADPAWLPDPKVVGELHWEVRVGAKGDALARVAVGSGTSAEITPPPAGSSITVELVDRHGMRSPAVIAHGAALAPAAASVKAAMVATLRQLNLQWSEGSVDDASRVPSVGMLECAADGRACVYRLAETEDRPGRLRQSGIELQMVLADSDGEATRAVESERSAHQRVPQTAVVAASDGPLTGFRASTASYTNDDSGEGYGNRETLMLRSGTLILSAQRLRSCVSLSTDAPCGSTNVLPEMTIEMAALARTARTAGLLR